MASKPLFHKHVTEVVGSGLNELKHQHGEPTKEGFRVLRLGFRSDRGVKRGPRSKGKVGRPPLYNGMDRIIMRGALKQYGLTGAQKYLAKERGLDVSLTVLRSVAKQFDLNFKRGRPAA